jgi:hypothetical protein
VVVLYLRTVVVNDGAATQDVVINLVAGTVRLGKMAAVVPVRVPGTMGMLGFLGTLRMWLVVVTVLVRHGGSPLG